MDRLGILTGSGKTMDDVGQGEWSFLQICFFFFFFESKQFIYSVRNVHSRETEQHYLNIVM